MAARRPIVRAGGSDKQLPTGDTLLGVPVHLLAYQRDGMALKLPLTINYALPVLLAAGGSLAIQVVLNG